MAANWFIGFPIPKLTTLDAALATCPSELRRFHDCDLHITVAFLGAVTETQALQAWTLATSLPMQQTLVTFGRLSPFGPPHRPSAFAYELDQGRVPIGDFLRRHSGDIRLAAGVKPENRAPRPHMTVARPKRNASQTVRQAAQDWASSVNSPTDTLLIDTIALFTWAEDRRTSLFKITHRARLADQQIND